ncbi:hypothetical protein BH24ACT5_BH24ACT5_13770 [soil metagenome]
MAADGRSDASSGPPSLETSAPDDLVFELMGTLRPPQGDAELAAAGISFDNLPVTRWRVAGALVVADGSGDPYFSTTTLDIRFPKIQTLPNDRIVICDPLGFDDRRTHGCSRSTVSEETSR